MAPVRVVTSSMEVFSKLVMMPIARHNQRRRRVTSAASEILTEKCRVLRRRLSVRSDLAERACGLPPCRHRGNAPSAAGPPPPRCCCDSAEFAARRGFIRPRLGLVDLLVDVEREGSDRHADAGPSLPRRCDSTEFVAGRRFIRRRVGFGDLLIDVEREGSDRHADAGPSLPSRCDSTEFVAGRRFIRRRVGFSDLLVDVDGSDRHADAVPPPPRCCDSTGFATGRRFIRRRVGLGDLVVESDGSGRHATAGPSPPRCRDSTELVAGRRFIQRRLGNFVESVGDGTNFPRRQAGIHDDDADGCVQAQKLRAFLDGFSGKLVDQTMEMPDEILTSLLDHLLIGRTSRLAFYDDLDLAVRRWGLPPPRLYGISPGAVGPPRRRWSERFEFAAPKRICRSTDCRMGELAECNADGIRAEPHRAVEIHGEPPEDESIGLLALTTENHRTVSVVLPQPMRPSARHQQVPRRWWSSSHEPNVPPSPSSPPPPPPPADSWNINIPLTPSAIKTEMSTIDETLVMKFDPLQFVRSNKLMETYQVLGQTWKFTKLKEPTKYLFDSLILLVESIHETGRCFSQISTCTVLITSSWKFVLLEGTFALNNWSVKEVKKDYRDVAILFRKLISESMGEEIFHPPDFEMLLNSMEKNGFKYKYLIGTHVSLLPADNICTVYMKIYEFIRKILPVEERDKAKQVRLGLTRPSSKTSRQIRSFIPYNKIWLTKARSNSFMAAFLKQNERHMELGGTDFELLDTIRHLICHRMDLLRLGFRYKASEVDLMWYAEFPTLLAKLQLALFLSSRLEELELEKNFMIRKPMRPKVSSHASYSEQH